MLTKPTRTTTTKGDVFHGKTLEAAYHPLEAALASGQITQTEYTHIRNYVAQKQVLTGVSILRVTKLVSVLMNWRKFIGPFDENDFSEVTQGLSQLYTTTSSRGTKFSNDTIADYIRVLKTFQTWMYDEGINTKITPAQLKKIKIPDTVRSRYADGDVLTTEQIETLVSRCGDLELRTMFTLLYEGGLRIGELGTLRWNQLVFYKDHVNLIVKYKTSYTRQIPIILYHQYISMWRNTRSDTSPDAYVFTNRFGKPYMYASLVKRLNRLKGENPSPAEIAVWKKHGDDLKPIPFKMHQIRHTRITHMIQAGMPKEVVAMICWGKLNADELDRYVHIFGSVDSMALRFYGITPAEKSSGGILKPEICKSCGYLNSPGSVFCSSCNSPLTPDAQKQFEEMGASLSVETIQRFIRQEIQNRIGTQ